MPELSKLEILTPPARLAFPSLFKAKKRHENSDRMTFQANLLIPPDVSLKPFHACMAAAMRDKRLPEGTKLDPRNNPIRSCDTKDYEGYEDGWHYISTHTGYQPGVVDQTRAPILDADLYEVDPEGAIKKAEQRIFAGCWARFYLTAFAWSHKTGGKGVSFSLNAVQLVREDDRLDGRRSAAAVFDAIEVPDDSTAADSMTGGDDDGLADMFG